MIYFLYNLVFPVILMVMLPFFLLRMCRRGGYARGFGQRVGWYDGDLKTRLAGKPHVWVHAVSVGETYVALKFMEAWRAARPGLSFVMSVNTSTAHALAEKSLPASDALIYFPLDFPPIVRHVFKRVNPSMLVLTECEVWPNLIRMCCDRSIPVLLMNGRLSDRSFKGYFRFRSLFAPVLGRVDRMCVQGIRDRDRFLQLGVRPERVLVTGSAKYDVAVGSPGESGKALSILATAGMTGEDLILLGGSTWPGEEEVLLDYFVQAKTRFPRLKLVLVPRHAERRDAVVMAIQQRHLSFAQRSRSRDSQGLACDVLLVDTTGELKHLYTLASVIFVGKSLTQHGGQNIIEPAVCGKPIVVGPNMENFLDITLEFRQAEALLQVDSVAGVFGAFDDLLQAEARRQALGQRAAALVAAHTGCIRKTMEQADALLVTRA